MPDQRPDVDGPITAGRFHGPADPHPPDLASIGYVEEEYFVGGAAPAYDPVGSFTADGRWDVEPAAAREYRTRCVVRRPADRSACSGVVIVEWLNVSVVEAAPGWAYTARSIASEGAVWVGVSAQAHGVIGGRSALETGAEEQLEEEAGGLRALDPERYSSLRHPGDDHAFAMFSQVGSALRHGFGGLDPARWLIAAGQSQSASYLCGFINAVQPLDNIFDGFFVHGRGRSVVTPPRCRYSRDDGFGSRLRTDLDAPVLVIESETEVGPVFGFAEVRQPDTDRLRTWETAGTAHADAFLVGTEFRFCDRAINNGPQHFVTNAGMAALVRWVREGVPPASAMPLATSTDGPRKILRDPRGIAIGGVRTPVVDVPFDILSGDPDEGASPICELFGHSTPVEPASLREWYGTPAEFRRSFEASLDDAIAAGFVRPDDREIFLAEADHVDF